MTRSNVRAARVNGCSLVVATICARVLPEGTAHAVSRLGDGHLVLTVVEGPPCFGVDRFLGPISLFYTRKFSFHAGEAEVSSIEVVRRAAGGCEQVWQVEMLNPDSRWPLDPGQCIRLSDPAPTSASSIVAPQVLTPGQYNAWFHVRDARRDEVPRLWVDFCVLANGQVTPSGYASKEGQRVCGEPIPDVRAATMLEASS